MQPVDAQLVKRSDQYIEDLFAGEDSALARSRAAASAAGLPDIHVSASEGKLIYLLAKIVRARRVLEIGTLGGYSTTWLARAVGPGGKVVSLELSSMHADVARRNIADGAPGVEVEVLVGNAAGLLRRLIDAREAPFDLIFIDADKPGYAVYLD